MPDVVLTVNGRRYDGWTSVRIGRGIREISGSFMLKLTDRSETGGEVFAILPGDACTVSVDSQTLITGHVDDMLPYYDAAIHEIRVEGRDAAGDLVDCSAENVPGRWENRSLSQIAADICRPFGIGVSVRADVGARFRSFALQPGETAFEAIERLCRFRGVLPVSDGLGNMVITGPGTSRVPVRLVEGENILAASGILSWRDRFSTYTVKGSDSGFDDSTPDQNAGPSGKATDPGVGRYRPTVLISEIPGDASELKRRAVWEAAVRRGESSQALISVQGWRHTGGLWSPNSIVHVSSPRLRLDADMIIVRVELTRDDNGTRSDLELCMPDALRQLALAENTGLWE